MKRKQQLKEKGGLFQFGIVCNATKKLTCHDILLCNFLGLQNRNIKYDYKSNIKTSKK